MSLKKNRGGPVIDGAQRFLKWHWGIPHQREIEWNDPDLPDTLVECGRLVEVRVRQVGQRKSTHITLSEEESEKSHLVFDPAHRAQRLYFLLSPAVRGDIKARFWKPGEKTWDINDLAETIGGRHGTRDYPPVRVQVIGTLTNLLYRTWKKGDDDDADPPGCTYIHACGEESGLHPALSVDARGRLWVVGANYTAPNPGITD